MLRAIINFSSAGTRRAGNDMDLTVIVRRAGFALLSVAVATVLAACGSSSNGSSPGDGAGAGSSDGSTASIAVVTSTNVWGDVVAQVGGQYTTVRPLVTDPSADPHSFEPSAQAQLAVSNAELIVKNGGGYDDWMTTLIDASGSVAPVIDAVDLFASSPATSATGTSEADAEPFNEHVWYDLPTVDAVAQRVAEELSGLRPEQATYFKANADAFADKIAGLTTKVQAI